MSACDPMSDPRDCGADAAGYVLGALEGVDLQRFRRHVAECVVCRDEVATLQTVADALAMTVPQLRAPGAVKRHTLARIREASSKAATSDRARWLHWNVRRPAFASSPSFPTRRMLTAAALLAVVATAAGAVELAPRSTTEIRAVSAAVIDQGQLARAVLHLDSGHAELVVSHMPAAPSGRIYQVWLQHPGEAPKPTSALFGVTSNGAGAVDVPGSLTGVSVVLVTPEPLGGSQVPTHAPVILAALPS